MLSEKSRVWIAYFLMLVGYAVAFLFFTQVYQSNSNEIGGMIIILGGTAIGSGIIGGILAPYSTGYVIKRIMITLAIPTLIGGIVFIAIGRDIGLETSEFSQFIMIILFIVIIVAFFLALGVTSLGILLGLAIGSIIGKSFTSDYRSIDYGQSIEPQIT